MRPNNNIKLSIRKHSSGRRGFTLLETLLAVAILLVLTLLVYQGFVSAMHMAANTAMFEKTANVADGQANDALSGSNVLSPAPGTVFLNFDDASITPIGLGINTYSAEPAPAGNFGAELDDSTHRHVFTYAP